MSEYIRVNPERIEWCCNKYGITEEVLSKKIDIKLEKLIDLLEKKQEPLVTYNQTLVLINDGWGDCKISRDGGASWTILDHSHFNCVDVSADGNYILLGEVAIDGAAGRILLSTDNG